MKNKRDVIIKQKLREIKIKHILQKPIDDEARNDLSVLAPLVADRSNNNSSRLKLNLSKLDKKNLNEKYNSSTHRIHEFETKQKDMF